MKEDFYNDEFRWKWCRFCHHKKTTLDGNICGLDELPIISKDHCPNYSENQSYIQQLEFLENEKIELNEEKKFVRFMQAAGFIILLITFAWAVYSTSELDEEYRWTLAKPTEFKVTYGLRLPPAKTFLCYEYLVNNKKYENRHEIESFEQKNELLDGYYFIRFNPSKPIIAELPELYKASSHLSPNDMPLNGVHSDSLEYFLARLRRIKAQKGEKIQTYSTTPQKQKTNPIEDRLLWFNYCKRYKSAIAAN